jgi:regulator of CtrA degradation
MASAPLIKVKKNLSGRSAAKCVRLTVIESARGGALAFSQRERIMARVTDFVENSPRTVSFVERLAGSEAFGAMFREGMGLVEEAAAYLDGTGREEAKTLPRTEALAYAAESMRLTTRLMQIASWLLLQRAVNQGELTRVQAASDRHRVKLQQQELASNPAMFQRLPGKLRDLAIHSVRLQARIIHLDQLIYAAAPKAAPIPVASPVEAQIEMLRNAFAR